jgi:predicted phosphatase
LGPHPCCQTLPNHHNNYMSFKIPWRQISSSNIHASQVAVTHAFPSMTIKLLASCYSSYFVLTTTIMKLYREIVKKYQPFQAQHPTDQKNLFPRWTPLWQLCAHIEKAAVTTIAPWQLAILVISCTNNSASHRLQCNP